jgi:hypothetical protein
MNRTAGSPAGALDKNPPAQSPDSPPLLIQKE